MHSPLSLLRLAVRDTLVGVVPSALRALVSRGADERSESKTLVSTSTAATTDEYPKAAYDAAFHQAIEAEERPQAERLADYVSEMFPEVEHVYDFGCSGGIYVRALQERLGARATVTGFEFSPEAVAQAASPAVQLANLTEPLALIKPAEPTLGYCYEVLEHIADAHWQPVLENLTRLSDVLLFTAALPGQGGTHHINCRKRLDWIRRFGQLGWVVDLDATEHLVNYMRQGYHLGWFVQNAMVLVPHNRPSPITTFSKYY